MWGADRVMRLVRSNPPNLSFVENLQKVSCCRCHGNSPPQADFFKGFWMLKCNFVRKFNISEIQNFKNFACGELMGTLIAKKNPYGKDFLGHFFCLWERKTAPKPLMGKILAGHPPTPVSGTFQANPKGIYLWRWLEKVGVTF